MENSAGWSEVRDEEEWDGFVTRNGSSVYHLWSWRKVLEGEGMRLHYLAYRGSDGKILAVCPFVLRAGRHFHYLESLPESNSAGPLISPGADPSEVIAALPKSMNLHLPYPIAAVRVRTYQPSLIRLMKTLGFRYRSTNELFILDLQNRAPEHIWNNGFDKHDRQAVKYYDQRAKFRFEENERDYLALARPDWKLYTGMLFHRDFISKVRATLGDRFQIALAVNSSGAALAGFQMLTDPPNGGDTTVHLLAIRHSAPNNIHSAVTYINWKAVNWAKENGFRYVDFGSFSKDGSSTPTHIFYKLKERFEITPMPRYEFTLPISVSYSIARVIKQVF